MIRRLPILLIAFVALLAVEPLLHQHPLLRTTETGQACVVCAAGASYLTDPGPAISAPVHIEFISFDAVSATVSNGIALTLPARAPPTA